MSIKRAEEKKASLRDRLVAIEREILGINEEIAKLDTYIDIERMFETERSLSLPQLGTGDEAATTHPPRAVDERFRNKSYKSATCLVLEIEGRPMSLSEIADKLTEVGIEFVAADPGRSVFSALAAAARDGYVRRVSYGMWEIVPEEERQSEILTKKVNSRDLSEKTRLALSRAKARGVKLGVKEKMTDDQRALVVKMATDGMSIPAMAKAVGFSVGGLSKWMNRHQIQRSVGRPIAQRQMGKATSSPTSSPPSSEQSAGVHQQSVQQAAPSRPSAHQIEQTPEPDLVEPPLSQLHHQ